MELQEYLQQPYQGGESFINKVIIPIFGEELFEDGYNEDMLESHPEHLKLAQQTSIKSIIRLGTIQIPFNETNVFDITVADKVQMEHNRVAIQLLVRRMMSTYSSAFMIFHYEDDDKWDWRFTFCSKGDNRKEMTESKRYTFLLGPSQSCRTAADNFQKLFQKHGNIVLKDIEAAFDVEALSKEFFGKYKEHYEHFVEYITGKRFVKEKSKWVEKQMHDPHVQMYNDFGKDDKRVRDYIKKLLGRIVFLHFLQRKGWMNGDLNYMQNMFERSIYKDNYLDAVLEPLFFGVLNTKPIEREDLFTACDWDKSLLAEWESIPYLNGGLFERDKDDEPESAFPADYFKRLFQFFSEYNFTIDENDPNDAQVGVDPEMLGRIFENLLEDNKDKGAFYTPKEIVQYMCRESLISYLQTDEKKCDYDIIANFVKTHITDELSDELKERLDKKLCDVKVCDPAIGSGAFPMGLLRELFFCRGAIENFDNAADIKKHIIQNNIYGVDIERGAVDIARLRFWLSLVVDETTPHSLPNLDFKIMQGNSLLESYQGVDLSTLTYQKREKENIYQMTLFDSETDIERRTLSAIINKYYDCADHAQKEEIMEQIVSNVNKQIELQNYNVNLSVLDIAANDQFFLWHTWFSDVFNRPSKCGFDIVIGNPPYNELRDLSGDEQNNYRKNSKYQKYASGGRMNLFQYFYPLGFDITCGGGVISMITQNSLLAESSALNNRKLIFERATILSIDSFPERDDKKKRVFESVKMSVCICVLRNQKTIDNQPFRVDVWKDREFIDRHSLVISKSDIKNIYANELIIPICDNTNFSIIKKINRVDNDRIYSINSSAGEIDMTKYKNAFSSNRSYLRVITGAQVQRYFITNTPSQGAVLYLNLDSLELSKGRLEAINNPRIVLQRITGVDSRIRIIATLIDKTALCANSTNYISCSANSTDLYYILGVLNSRLINFYFKQTSTNTNVTAAEISKLPIVIDDEYTNRISSTVAEILCIKDENPQADTNFLESEIDQLVYKLYGLSKNEIDIIESV